IAPGDGINRWLPAIAINKDSTIAVGYSVSNIFTSPSLRLDARISTDFPGVLGQGEISLRNGIGFHENERWGDYFTMVVDPVDDSTFWFSGEFADNGNWG